MAIRMLSEFRDRQAAANPDARSSQIRQIELAAKAAHPDDMAARFAFRNAERARLGLGEEERDRGGLAGAYDKGFLLPAAALALGPLALTALGGGGGASSASGALPTAVPAAGGVAGAAGAAVPAAVPAAAQVGGLGGILGKVAGAVNSPTGQMLTKLGTAAYGIGQQSKANDLTRQAIAADRARWEAGAPLRAAGRDQLLDPTVADTSQLATLARRGNPFAIPAGGR